MKKMKEIAILCIFCLVLSLVIIPEKPAVQAASSYKDATSGALHVAGTKLKDKKGNTIQLRGVSTHGLSWFPGYVNNKMFKELHDKWGANVVRLAMYTEEYNGYCSGSSQNKKDLKALVKKGVKYATDNDLYVIIDWHILSDGNPKTHRKAAISFFKEMAKEYKNNTNVLYEICNEPNGGTSWSTIKSYAEDVIPAIRKYDKDAIVIVGTPTWSQDVDQAAANPIDEDNIMYSLHFYAGTHKKWLRDRAKSALESGLPLFVTEFGTTDASGNGTVNKTQSNYWINLLDNKKVSYVNWSLCNKNESSALIKSSVSKTSGLKRSNLSTSGKWYYDVLRKRAGLAK